MQLNKKHYNIALFFFIITLFLIPEIKILSSMPKFRLEDLLFPFIALYVIKNYKLIVDARNYEEIKKYIGLWLCFVIVIILSILFNLYHTSTSDLFEIYKPIKAIVLFSFFLILNTQKINTYFPLAIATFGLLIFNLFQYFDIWDFNIYVEVHYAPPHHLIYFGYNTLFEPVTKRLLGTLGNPNNNAILFACLSIYFLAIKTENKKIKIVNYILFTCCSIACIQSQSRTTFIGLALALVLYVIVDRKNLIVSFMPFIISLFIVVVYFLNADLRYLHTLKQLKITTSKNTIAIAKNEVDKRKKAFQSADGDFKFESNNESLKGRFEIWRELFAMAIKKPVLGYGPYKGYFYSNTIYSENEFLLNFWRYGLVGLVNYTLLVLFPFMLYFKNRNSRGTLILTCVFIIINISSLTNNPISSPFLLFLIMLLMGCNFSAEANEKK